jgi:hypothetical protein
VSEETKTLAGATAVARFAAGFRDMYYLVNSTDDEFDVAKFSRFFGDKPDVLDGSCVTIAPKDEETGAYNIHFLWQRLTSARLNFRVEYFKGTRRHDGDEHEPFAEDFMAWFGQFFKSPTVKSHLHAHFRYSLSDRSSKFPLPQQTNLADGAELHGISLRLTSNSDGVSTVQLTRRKDDWYVEIIADRIIKFKEFEPLSDVARLALTVSKFLEQPS